MRVLGIDLEALEGIENKELYEIEWIDTGSSLLDKVHIQRFFDLLAECVNHSLKKGLE